MQQSNPQDSGRYTSAPSLSDLVVAVMRSSLPRDETLVLISILTLAQWKDWRPVHKPIRTIAQRAKLCPRLASETIKALCSNELRLLKNLSPRGWALELELNIDAILALPAVETAVNTDAPAASPDAAHASPDAARASVQAGEPMQPVHGGMHSVHGLMQPVHGGDAARASITRDLTRDALPGMQYQGSNTEDANTLATTTNEILDATCVETSAQPALFSTSTKPAPKPKTATQKRLPLQPTRPPDLDPTLKALPHGRLLASLWYGTEVRRKGGPDREVFQTFADLLAEWASVAGEMPAIDRRGYNPVRETIEAWRASGRPTSSLLEACHVKPDAWEQEKGLTTFEYYFGSTRQVNKTLERRNAKGTASNSRLADMPVWREMPEANPLQEEDEEPDTQGFTTVNDYMKWYLENNQYVTEGAKRYQAETFKSVLVKHAAWVARRAKKAAGENGLPTHA